MRISFIGRQRGNVAISVCQVPLSRCMWHIMWPQRANICAFQLCQTMYLRFRHESRRVFTVFFAHSRQCVAAQARACTHTLNVTATNENDHTSNVKSQSHSDWNELRDRRKLKCRPIDGRYAVWDHEPLSAFLYLLRFFFSSSSF